ncbi:MAG: response regulator [Alphaproteobacteria bacterium]|nr:response regulator [Alphaproteobacteria bacterium]
MARVLLVDDDDLVRRTLAGMLEAAGHAVVSAAGGREALAILGDQAFDLVITDIFMPGADGMETIRGIRAMSKSIPVIAMSGGPRAAPTMQSLAAIDHMEIAQMLGATKALQKPIRKADLIAAVDECLTGDATAG